MSFFRRFSRRGERQEIQEEAEGKDAQVSMQERDEGVTLAEGSEDVPERLDVPEVVDIGTADPLTDALQQDPFNPQNWGQAVPGMDDLLQEDKLWDPLGGLADLPQDRGWDPLGGLKDLPQDSGWSPPLVRDESGWAMGGGGDEEWDWMDEIHATYSGALADAGAYDPTATGHGWDPADYPGGYDAAYDLAAGDPSSAEDLIVGHLPDPPADVEIVETEEEDEEESDERESQYGHTGGGGGPPESQTMPAPEGETPGTEPGGPPLVDPGGNVIDPNIVGGDVDFAPETQEGGATTIDPSALPGYGVADYAPETEEGGATTIDPSTLPGFGHTDPAEELSDDEPELEDLEGGAGDLL